MRFALAILSLLFPATVYGQALPAPQVQTQPANDNSSKAANTAFTRNMLGQYLPGFSASVAGTGIAGMDGTPGWFIYQRPSTYTLEAAFRAQRLVPSSAIGVPGNTTKAVWGLTSTSTNQQNYEWAVVGQVENYTAASTGAEHVGVNGTIFKRPTGVGTGEATKSWGGNFNCIDTMTIVNPTTNCTGAEVNSSTYASGTDANRQRVGLHVSLYHLGASTGAHFGYGVLMSSPAGDTIDRGHGLLGAYQFGLDTTGATFTGAPIMLASDQKIVFDGLNNGVFNRSLRFKDGYLIYNTQNGVVVQLGDTGTGIFSDMVQAAYVREPAAMTPASSSAACTTGDHRWDANYEYRCVATNTWKRAALSAF